MADLPERFRYLEDRQGLIEVGRVPIATALGASSRTLATMRIARKLTERVEEGLVGRVLAERGGDGAVALFLRDEVDPEWVSPVPLLELSFGPRAFVVGAFRVADPLLPEDAPPGGHPIDPERPPDIFPRGEDMRAGTLTLREGSSLLELIYDERGLLRETSGTFGDTFVFGRHPSTRPFTIDPLGRPPPPGPLSYLCRSELGDPGLDFHAIAHWIVEAARPASSARVRVPAPIPGGVRAAWGIALAGLRRQLFQWEANTIGVAVADGFEGTATASAMDRPAVLTAWSAALFRHKPKPPSLQVPSLPPSRSHEPEPGPIQDAEGNVRGQSFGSFDLRVGGGGPAVPWPAAIPSNTPAGSVEVREAPPVPEGFVAIGFSRTARIVGDDGAVRHAFVREDPGGFVLVGGDVVDLVDPTQLDAELDAAEARERAEMGEIPQRASPWDEFSGSLARYVGFDDGRRKIIPLRYEGGQFADHTFDGANLDGNLDAWRVVRVRRRG